MSLVINDGTARKVFWEWSPPKFNGVKKISDEKSNYLFLFFNGLA